MKTAEEEGGYTLLHQRGSWPLSSSVVEAQREDRVCVKLQALVYDSLPSQLLPYLVTSSFFGVFFFFGAQTVVGLLQTTQIISDVCFI